MTGVAIRIAANEADCVSASRIYSLSWKAGYGYGRSRDYDDSAWGEVTSFYSLPEVWGRGYARPLMDFIVAEMKKAGMSRFHVWVLRDNGRARRFYEKCGFVPSGKEKEISRQEETVADMEYVLGGKCQGDSLN